MQLIVAIKIHSNLKLNLKVKYHGEYEKLKNKYTPTPDNLEITRAIENQKMISAVEYKGSINKNKDTQPNASISSFQRISQDSQISLNEDSLNNDKNFLNITNSVTYKAGEKKIGNSYPLNTIYET